MKRITVIFVTLCMLLTLFVPFAVVNGEISGTIEMYVDSGKAFVNGTECYIDNDNKAVTPIVENARTLVPVRFIAESLKMNVAWNEESQLVTIENENSVVKFIVGSNEMIVNDEKRPIDAENDKIIAKTENDRTLIPVRALLEAIGKKVFYDRGLIIISDNENIYNAETDKTVLDGIISKLNVLPTVGTAENLEKLVGSVDNGIRYFGSGGGGVMVTPAMMEKSADAVAPTNAKSDYSQTNTQVSGVDEADVVKTDGEYVYQVNNQRIVIAKINPAQEMSVTNIISRVKEQFNPIDMYVDGNKLVVFANIIKNYDQPQIIDSANTKMIRRPDYYNNNLLECAVYDITDRKAPKLERTLDIEGGYISSRKIGDVVYIVANKNIYYYGNVNPLMKGALTYTDSAVATPVDVGFDKVRYFPNFEE